MRTAPARQGLYDPAHEHDACGLGFVVDLDGRPSHELVEKGLEVLFNLRHRGACGWEADTGDGAGALLQVPHRFLAGECDRLRIDLPDPSTYGVGMVFLPVDAGERAACERLLDEIAREEGQRPLGWRTVPADGSALGRAARDSQPVIRQVFLGRAPGLDAAAFERRLYVIRRRVERAVQASALAERGAFYVASLSCRTVVYKGMLKPDQLAGFYPDLSDGAVETALVMVHSRFSTNTFPSWARAHPYRYLCHNGEINTLRGNVNWMQAREGMLRSDLFGADLGKLLPIVDESGSDSAIFDNVLEMLVLAGRSLPHAMMMMSPEPWSGDPAMSEAKRAFYEYHACLMEPWDGPASIAFTDGRRVGAVLDRNGLRPSRYYVTRGGRVVVSSEVGVLDLPPEEIVRKGRLQPGRMFLVDLDEGRIVEDGEVKERIAAERPYALWLERHQVALEDLPSAGDLPAGDPQPLLVRQQAFGYTTEELRMILAPMAADGIEAIGSMGTDTPLAVLSERPQLLYSYFKQLFAQVTNPPVDALREHLIMSFDTTIGAERNLLEPEPESARQVKLRTPILDNLELAKLQQLDGLNGGGFRSRTLPMLFPVRERGAGLERALDDLCRGASAAAAEGYDFLILSDRGVSPDLAPVPALLGVAAVHHHLLREESRTRIGLVVESGEPREVHHFALLIGYGAGAVNPYLAFESLSGLIDQGQLPGLRHHDAIEHFIKAATKGIVKVMSKMGISTIQSYCGAQIFEAIGLDRDLVDRFFTRTPSRVSGVGLDVLAEEAAARHARAFPDRPVEGRGLESGGQYQWRRDGEAHLFNPETVHLLQLACRTGSYERFKRYSGAVDTLARNLCTLRGLFELKRAERPLDLAEVEPVESIVRRFKTGAMSYGSIGKEAHETLAIAMNRLGGKSNTGEGGEDPARYAPGPGGESRNSAIKQVASARFGVTSEYLVQARELQIKMAQGAKPGEGGQLPGHKVYPWIAKVRHATPGVGLISPPPHHDIYSIEDLAQLIFDLKNANRAARISVKLVAEVGVGTVAAGVAKAKADVVLISGHDGGTGASPLTSIKHAGVPWELGLAETQQTLVLNNLRSRIAVEVDGQLKTGRDVVIGALLGAEEFGFATAPLVALGCVMMRVCHLNTCPVGVATQDPALRARFAGSPEHVENFMRFIAEEVRELMAELGFRTVDEMVGRSDRLELRPAVDHWKARGLDYSAILHRPDVPAEVGRRRQVAQEHGLDAVLDATTLLELCHPALEHRAPVAATLPIRNTDRAVGTILGSEVTRRHGWRGLADSTIRLRFRGSAGQSFGAFLPRGVHLVLEGDANDYIGKGLSGGRIVVHPPSGSTFAPEENVIIGNVAFYGATSGEAYIHGVAGERFCVRNSGLHAVVDAVGDHGCEYMTGGRVVVLGATGRNFAAGMSGGVAYVLDREGDFRRRCNTEMVELGPLEDGDEIDFVYGLVSRFAHFTRSRRARRLLALWNETVPLFVKVLPNDYRRVIETQRRVISTGISVEEAVMIAFEQNARDAARSGGT